MHIGDFPYMQVSAEQTIQQACAIVSMGFFVDSGQMVLYGFDADVEPPCDLLIDRTRLYQPDYFLLAGS